MLPGAILGGLNFIPTEIGFGLMIGLFDESPLAFALGQNRKWGIFGGIAECVGMPTTGITTEGESFLANLAFFSGIFPCCPDPAGGKIGGQVTTVGGANGQRFPGQAWLVTDLVNAVGMWT